MVLLLWLPILLSLASAFQIPNCRLQAGYPRGMRVWIPDVPGIESFTFRGQLNSPYQGQETGGLVGTVSAPIGGNWIFKVDGLQLKPGDLVYFWTYVIKEKQSYSRSNQTWRCPSRDKFVDLNSPIPSPDEIMESPTTVGVTPGGIEDRGAFLTTTMTSEKTKNESTTAPTEEQTTTILASTSPTTSPTTTPTTQPTTIPTTQPTTTPTTQPTTTPTTILASTSPTTSPTTQPTTILASTSPTTSPTTQPTTTTPTTQPTTIPNTGETTQLMTAQTATPSETQSTMTEPTTTQSTITEPTTTQATMTTTTAPLTTDLSTATETSMPTDITTKSSDEKTTIVEETTSLKTTDPVTKAPLLEKRSTTETMELENRMPNIDLLPPKNVDDVETTTPLLDKPVSEFLEEPAFGPFPPFFPGPYRPMSPPTSPELEICSNPFNFMEQPGETKTDKLERKVNRLQCELAQFQRKFSQLNNVVETELMDIKKLNYNMVNRMARLETLLLRASAAWS